MPVGVSQDLERAGRALRGGRGAAAGGGNCGVDRAGGFVEAVVAPAFGVAPAALKSRSRGPAAVAFARQVAVYLAHTRFGLSYSQAGAYFRRDRTTAAHACRVVEDRREDSRFDALLGCLESAVDRLPDLVAGRSDGA